MFGQFQQSNIRLEVKASSQIIQNSLTQPDQLKKWLWMQRFESLPSQLDVNSEFTTYLGVVPVKHHVDVLHDHGVRFLLSQGIDGFHEWSWDDGWLQSRLEGISLLPLNLGQTVALLSLRHFVESRESEQS
ncbi:hypothetical protein Lepto7376_2442 [[Leptolyngbya] sp. PCC 7376]|uniref:hypothetical protein n=1 Tax=[Leptolyngbya] sp. PCC 7376 TaxID=111781 RepID=UPI00029EEC71|nr:hypothetical protein [[Leptolyngbya] sp. PCC 7376]AFY38721.1 hypothetical protein Lepto7376_2442 [[Leptolyngbya] sp. PCC 7376]